MSFNNLIAKKFRTAFEKKCFRLIIDAYKKSIVDKEIQLDWNENDISFELFQNVENNSLRCQWHITTNVENFIPNNIQKIKGFSSKLPRIDMRFTTFSFAEEFKYFFEAKNLKQNDSALKRRYIKTGIDSFISEKYPHGSLLGYLLEGDTASTIDGINVLLKKDKREDEVLELKSHFLLESYYESKHPKIDKLKHLIFDFTKLSN